MTMVVHTLVALPGGPGDWKAWRLDYSNHAEILGEFAGGPDGYYFPPKTLEQRAGVRSVDVESGFFVVEMPHDVLVEHWGPEARVSEAYGSNGPGSAVGQRIADLDPDPLYAVVWLEVY